MRDEGKRRGSFPYRVLLVVIMGSTLALLLAAFSEPSPLKTRTLLLLLAGLLLIIAIALEVVFRDVTRLRERVRILEAKKDEKPQMNADEHR
jgi:CHASE1-domain containing sensor protein